MGFFDLFFTTDNKLKLQEPVQKKAYNPAAMYPIFGNTGINWLNDNSQAYITNGYAGNPVIYSIIKQITDKMSAVPFYLYEIQDTKKLKRYKSFTLNKNLMSAEALIAKDQSLKEVDSHKIIDLLDQPNEYQQWSEFVKNVIGYKLITGNSYIYGSKPEIGVNKDKIIGLSVLPAQLMNIVATGNIVEYYNLSGNNQRLEKDSILHLKYWNPDFNNSLHLYGQSPLKAAQKVMQLSNTAYETQASIIQNKGAYGMLFDKSQSLDDVQMQQLKDRFMNATANELMMVSADLQFTQFGQTAEDMQIMESMGMNLRDLCNIYSFPSLLLGDDTQKTYSNYEQAEKSLIYNVVVPELTTLRDSLNKWLCPAYSKADGKQYFIDFDITVLPQLAADMDKVVAQLEKMWWVTGNEKRLATNYGEDTKNPLMNEYFIPQNLVPLSDTSISLNTDPNQDLSDYN